MNCWLIVDKIKNPIKYSTIIKKEIRWCNKCSKTDTNTYTEETKEILKDDEVNAEYKQ